MSIFSDHENMFLEFLIFSFFIYFYLIFLYIIIIFEKLNTKTSLLPTVKICIYEL